MEREPAEQAQQDALTLVAGQAQAAEAVAGVFSS